MDWATTTLDGRNDVTLVTVELRNPSSVDRRVRVDNRLDELVLPPRQAGVPDPGWDEEGFTGVVPATGRLGIGYACPAPPKRPPVDVVDEGRARGGAPDPAATAVRELGDPRPPADAVPATIVDEGEDGGDDTGDDGSGSVPPAVEAWLTAVERRLDCGERLTDASVAETSTVLETADWDVTDLDSRLATDANELRRVAERTAALADRAEAVDVPVAALRRLA